MRRGSSDPSLVQAAVKSMAHRGPDDSFADVVPAVGAWGMCRLAIRDPTPEGMQPFWDGDDVGLIYNGEIYNTDRLRRVLEVRGHRFESRCDTEILLRAYVEFGTACFGLLDGIFAVAIIDRRRQRLVLARDEFGVKPLAYWSSGGELCFASELTALRALGVPATPDLQALSMYLRFQYVPEPLTAIDGVSKVPPGTAISFDLLTLQQQGREHFVQPDDEGSHLQAGAGSKTPQDWVDLTEDALCRSVQRQLVSDRPLGVFLSGGVDSSLVALFAGDAHPGIRAFGISIPSWDKDERPYMEQAARRLRVDLTVVEMGHQDFEPLLDRVLSRYDEPFGDFSSVPTSSIAAAAARDLRVVLTGDGGDELFAGYQRYALVPKIAGLARAPIGALDLGARLLDMSGRRSAPVLRSIAEERRAGGAAYAGVLSMRSWPEIDALISPSTVPRQPLIPAARAPLPSIDAACAADIAQYLPADILTKVDRATMAVSLEARVPLLGGPVARLAADMPMSIKRYQGIPKWPLKMVLRRRGFDEEFLHRSKTGFSLPIDVWLRESLLRRDDLARALTQPAWPLRPAATTAELDAFLAGAPTGHRLWSLLSLATWLRRL